VALCDELVYLDDGDVIRIDPRRQRVDVLYRRWSGHNSLLVTEQCNSRCVMCSQPPRLQPDRHLVDDLLRAIPLMHPSTVEIGLPRGQPDSHRRLAAGRRLRAERETRATTVVSSPEL
jgi:hypothetical protein